MNPPSHFVQIKSTVIVVIDFFMSYGSFDAADAKISCRVESARWSEHELQLKCVILLRKIQLIEFLAIS